MNKKKIRELQGKRMSSFTVNLKAKKVAHDENAK